MSILHVWDGTAPIGEDDAVPCDPAGDTVIAPESGVYLYVTNTGRRQQQIRMTTPAPGGLPIPADRTFTVHGAPAPERRNSPPPKATMMFGPFGLHLEEADIRVEYPSGVAGLRILAFSPPPPGTTVTHTSPVFGYQGP